MVLVAMTKACLKNCDNEKVFLRGYDDKGVLFPKEWLCKVVYEVFGLGLEEFLSDYSYDDTEFICDIAETHNVQVKKVK